MKTIECPLCKSQRTTLYLDLSHHKNGRKYYECSECSLVYADDSSWLNPQEEKERYENHINDPLDNAYRNFLDKLLIPLAPHLSKGAEGLDFGCGPGPTISTMMGERGFKMNNYDPFFHDDKSVLERKYDFITCTEVLEHMFRPMIELKLLRSIVNEKGVVGLMTEFVPAKEKFSSWYYKNDPTHVSFYSKKTFEWIAAQLDCEVQFEGNSVAILYNFKNEED